MNTQQRIQEIEIQLKQYQDDLTELKHDLKVIKNVMRKLNIHASKHKVVECVS